MKDIHKEWEVLFNDLVSQFLDDLEKIKKECDIRGNILIGYESIREKWQKQLGDGS